MAQNVNQGFWTQATTNPKRKYRFQVQFAAGATTDTAMNTGPIWFAKTVDKPEITVNTAEANYLAHRFYFPGTVEWNEINVALVDPVSPDAARATLEMLQGMGYLGPTNAAEPNPITPGKSNAFSMRITQIDENGIPQETWTLNNAIITKLAFGELDYSSEDLSEITMTLRYDWANCEAGDASFFL